MAFTIDGTTISDDQLSAEMQRIQQEDQQRQQQGQAPEPPLPGPLAQKRLEHQAKERLIGRTLLEAEAKRRIDKVPAEVVNDLYKRTYGKQEKPTKKNQAEIEQRRAQIKQYARMQMLMHELGNELEKPTDAEIEEWYAKHRHYFTKPESAHASHIVIHLQQDEDDSEAREKLEGAMEKLEGGADFGEVAGEMSDCADQKGDLGTFPRGQMVEEFEDVVFNLEPGTHSDIFRSPFGLHIAKLHEKTEAEVTPLEEVKERILEAMWQERHQAKVEGLVEELKEKADIQEN